jgi:hypothetical protein
VREGRDEETDPHLWKKRFINIAQAADIVIARGFEFLPIESFLFNREAGSGERRGGKRRIDSPILLGIIKGLSDMGSIVHDLLWHTT